MRLDKFGYRLTAFRIIHQNGCGKHILKPGNVPLLPCAAVYIKAG